MKYGSKPVEIFDKGWPIYCHCKEMMFYQYLPIKMSNSLSTPVYEDRLKYFSRLIQGCEKDFIQNFGLEAYRDHYIYLTVKHQYQLPNCSYNREGWHSDGFMSDDINYIWSNRFGTEFNFSEFNLTQDHNISLKEMEEQALPENNFIYEDQSLLRLDQFNIHRVQKTEEEGMRTFFKLSFSKEKYNLIGNSHNYELDYKWDMLSREVERNHPVKL